MANDEPTIHTGGGASVGKDTHAGRDFVGRDQINTTTNIILWTAVGEEFINDLEKNRQLEQGRKCALKKQSEIDKVIQKIAELEQYVREFEHFDWSKAEKNYLEKVIKLYDRVRVLGASADVPLGNVFTQVYILDKPTARQRHDIDELRQQGHNSLDFQRQPGERTPGMELVKGGQNLFILGKPGAGKTTFLKYITIQAAHKQLPRIPIFVSLNEWADSRWGRGEDAEVLPFVVEQFAISGFPNATLFINYLLTTGQALLLFDGLDEVKQEEAQRRRLTRLLQDFARKYDRCQHLITCRIAASDYAFAGFSDVEVADFTPEQVDEYARHWFGENTKKAEAFASEIARPENRGLAELANTPLLLSMLCLTFDNAMRFPPNRAELYEDALDALLRKWDSSRQIQRDEIYRQLSNKRKLHLLTSIAVPAFEKGELFFRQRDLEKRIVDYLARLPDAPPADTIDGTVILKAMEAQHSILVERAQGIYSFSHLTFQEYLTARYLIENQGRGVTDRLIANHLTDPRWREVLLLTASLLEDADDFVTTVRTTIDELTTDAPTLINILNWTHERTVAAYAPVELYTFIRLAYIALTSKRAFALSLSRDRVLDHENDRFLHRLPERVKARSKTLEQARERELVNENIFSLANSLSPDLARVLELDSDLDIEKEYKREINIAILTSPIIGFDYGLFYGWGYANEFAVKTLSRHLADWQAAMLQFPNFLHNIAGLVDETELAQRLRAIQIPSPSESWRLWRESADALFVILRDERDLCREWDFPQDEIGKLNNYFYANELLVRCLKVAVVSDREWILQGLLSPPNG